MKNYNMILIERLQKYHKIDKYEYLTGKKILPSNQQQITEQGKFTYSPLGKGFEKQTKAMKDQGEKHIKRLGL